MSHDRREVPEGMAGGFTSLELLVVLGILALATIIVMPLGGQRHSSMSLRSAAFELAAHLRATRAAAIRNNVEKALTIDTFRAWSGRLAPEGVIAFHDYGNELYPGVTEAI